MQSMEKLDGATCRSGLGCKRPGLTRRRLIQQRTKLLKLRAIVSERVKQLSAEACEEIPNYSMHMADAATDSFGRDLALGLVSFEQEELYEIDSALKRVEDGTYGICEMTGQPIPLDRLIAIPWARFSVGAEKVIEGRVRPHIGELGTVRPMETETSDKAISGDDQLSITVPASDAA